jgi:glutamate N-acetyltransferase/amino-acid N-acetyltransferase
VAREVANSPLVKTAIYGGDPNWGRIAQAIGAALPGAHPLKYDIRVEGTLVCSDGFATREVARFEGDEVEIDITLPGAGAETEVFFSDLGHEYITINADYTT